jgi:hypothetical protein
VTRVGRVRRGNSNPYSIVKINQFGFTLSEYLTLKHAEDKSNRFNMERA